MRQWKNCSPRVIQEQGKALVRIIVGMQSAQAATKADLIETREALRSEIADLRNEMAALELRLTEKMSVMFTKMIIWLVGAVIASVSLVATIGQVLK